MKERIKVVVEEEIKELIPQYINNRKKDFELIKNSLDSTDFDTIKKIVHKIKGTAGSYGLDALGELAKKMEEEALKKNSEQIKIYLGEMQEYITLIDLD